MMRRRGHAGARTSTRGRVHGTARPSRAALALIVALGAGAAVPGCATGASSAPTPAPNAAPATSPDTTSASPRLGPDAAEATRLAELYRAQTEASRNRFTPADVSFMTGMIGHHAQALAMSALVPDRSQDPSIRTLARRIDSAQRDEIRLMEQWLQGRGEDVPSWSDDLDDHADHAGQIGHEGHAGHAPDMPGMLSAEQMAELADSTGPDFDRLFLTLMIEHHQGAVEMVRRLLATDGAAQDTEVFRFASDVQVDQATEIARMEQMLRERGGSMPGPAAPTHPHGDPR